MKRSTLLLLGIFLALAGLVFYLRQQDITPEEATEIATAEPSEFLLAETDSIPTSISIRSKEGQQVVLIRNEEGVWVLEKPVKTEANQGSAEAAATQLTSLRILSHPNVAPDVVGLIPGDYSISVKLSSNAEKTVRIGDPTPTGSGYYANINNSNKVIILSKSGVEALLILLASPPFANTPMP